MFEKETLVKAGAIFPYIKVGKTTENCTFAFRHVDQSTFDI